LPRHISLRCARRVGDHGDATAIAIATAVIAIGLSLAVSFAFKALGIGSVPSAKGAVGPPQVFRQSITNSFIVYGKRRVGGLLVFFHAKQSAAITSAISSSRSPATAARASSAGC
jgi:hypothetical protein